MIFKLKELMQLIDRTFQNTYCRQSIDLIRLFSAIDPASRVARAGVYSVCIPLDELPSTQGAAHAVSNQDVGHLPQRAGWLYCLSRLHVCRLFVPLVFAAEAHGLSGDSALYPTPTNTGLLASMLF